MRRERTQQDVNLNLTSMLDVIFLLIVFFILVTNFTTAQNVPMEPPAPEESQAFEPEERERVVVNVIPEGDTGRADRLRVGIRDIPAGQYGTLTELLEREREKLRERYPEAELQVDLRADRSLDYNEVQPVMDAITAAGIGRINLVALLETGE